MESVDIGKNFGLSLIAVKYQESSGKLFGGNKGTWQVNRYFVDYKFSKGDRIIVYGDNEVIKKLINFSK